MGGGRQEAAGPWCRHKGWLEGTGNAMYSHCLTRCILRSHPCTTQRHATHQPSYKPLHHAAYYGKPLCVAHLLQADDSILTIEDRGSTPAAFARRKEHSGVADALDLWQQGDHDAALADLTSLSTVSQKLFTAALENKLEDVTRLAPQASRLGVISKVRPSSKEWSHLACCVLTYACLGFASTDS